jgi:hypothetical protein
MSWAQMKPGFVGRVNAFLGEMRMLNRDCGEWLN